ncbi:MAG: elongation factor P [Verrucomicrobia bacterium]|nr:elongation factor P [Verrucomicrobiota bacterium]
MTYSASDLRKGLRIEIDGVPYIITEFTFVKPGKGQAIYTCKLKSLVDGSTFTKTYRDNATIDEPKLEERNLQFSYAEGDDYIFMDKSFEQVTIPASVLGDKKYFLVEEIAVNVLYHNDRAIDVTMPYFIEKKITFTEPGVRGDTATNVQKPATVEGGYQLQVPLFVNLGDVIRIDTRTGQYADRVTKK